MNYYSWRRTADGPGLTDVSPRFDGSNRRNTTHIGPPFGEFCPAETGSVEQCVRARVMFGQVTLTLLITLVPLYGHRVRARAWGGGVAVPPDETPGPRTGNRLRSAHCGCTTRAGRHPECAVRLRTDVFHVHFYFVSLATRVTRSSIDYFPRRRPNRLT